MLFVGDFIVLKCSPSVVLESSIVLKLKAMMCFLKKIQVGETSFRHEYGAIDCSVLMNQQYGLVKTHVKQVYILIRIS